MLHYIVDIALVILVALYAFLAWKKGFLREVFSLIRFGLTLLIVIALAPPVGNWIDNSFLKQPVYDIVVEKTTAFHQSAQGSTSLDALYQELPSFLLTEDVKSQIESVGLDQANWPEETAARIAEPLSNVLSTVIAYVAVFLLTVLALTVAIWFLDKLVEKIKMLDIANHILGLAFGLITSLGACLMISSVIKALWGTEAVYTKSILVKFLGESFLLDVFGFLDIGKNFLSGIM